MSNDLKKYVKVNKRHLTVWKAVTFETHIVQLLHTEQADARPNTKFKAQRCLLCGVAAGFNSFRPLLRQLNALVSVFRWCVCVYMCVFIPG